MAPGRWPKRRGAATSQGQDNANRNDEGGGDGVASTSKRKRTIAVKEEPELDMETEKESLIGDKVDAIKKTIDEIDDVEELCRMKQEWLQVRKYMETKIKARRAFLESVKAKDELQLSIGVKKPPHPLLNEVILTRLASFISFRDASNCRLVCTKWNVAICAHLKKIGWTYLTFDPTKKEKDPTCPKYLQLKEFLSVIGPRSTMFPVTQFTLLLNKIPPIVQRFFNIYSDHIKSLELRYHPKPFGARNDTEENNIRATHMNTITNFLLPAIPNCEHLLLSELTCQVFMNTAIEPPKKLALKHFDIEMVCTCDHENNNPHFLTSDTFLTKLIMKSQQLESLHVFLDMKTLGDLTVKRILTMVLSFANLGVLRNLSLRSEKIVRLNWTDDLPQNFQLKSLELSNVILWPLNTFLEHHTNTLECFNFFIDAHKWDTFRHEFQHNQIFSASFSKMKKLHDLSVTCLDFQEVNLDTILKPETLPALTSLRIYFVNEAFIEGHSSNRTENTDSGSDSDDEGSNENQIHVKILEVDIDDHDSPSDYHFLRHTFYGVQHLVLTTSQSKFLTPLWTSGFPLKTLELRVSNEDQHDDNADEYYIQHLDTIITGFSVNDCERVYQHIQQTCHSPGGFQLATFNFDYFESLCKDKEYPSIRNFSRLQRLMVSCSRKSSRLTEVTLAIVLLWIKSLTAISISNCCISQAFVKCIREQLPAGFFLDIDGVNIGDNNVVGKK